MIAPWNSPQARPNSTASATPSAGCCAPVKHRDASGEAEHAADGQIELADDHRQAKSERDRSDGGELLQHAERRRGGEKLAAPSSRIHSTTRDHDEQQIRTNGAVGEQWRIFCQ